MSVRGESAIGAVWRYQPLVPVAVAFAAGITLDRHTALSMWSLVAVAASALVVWLGLALWQANRRPAGDPLAGWAMSLVLLGAIAALGAAWHHLYWNVYPADDIGLWAERAARPARVRGRLTEEPLVVFPDRRDPLRARPETVRTLCAVAVEAIQTSADWRPASGRAQLVIDGAVRGLRAGEVVDVLGDLAEPAPATNPGQFDYSQYLRGRRTRAVIFCDESEAVLATGERSGWSISCVFQRLAGAAERTLVARLPRGQAEIAVALLLGRYELMEEDVTEYFLRTGTMHILAISGQHLAILAGFLWLLLHVLPVPRKCGALALGLVVISYALLTGARPPVVRAAVLVCVFVGAIVLECRSRRANPLALALITVLAVNPADLFDRGLQLSFLAVAALAWMVDPLWSWAQGTPDPMSELLAETRPRWQTVGLKACRWLAFALLMGVVAWLASVPLLANRFHVFSPIVVPLTVLITPLATVALIAGLLLLLVDSWVPGIGWILAKLCGWSVAAMEWCVRVGSHVPGGYWYVPGPPTWWLAGFYGGMAAVLLFRPTGRARWRWATASIAWLALGLAVPALRPAHGEFECQVLAAGHGLAAVLHLPDGGTVLVDAGQATGPRVGSRLIAPALWDAGIRRIDAVFISHADVDHFNGLPHLADRFGIGAVFVPPHFAGKQSEAVRVVGDALALQGVPLRVCWAGDRFQLGSDVVAHVLHPPADFGGSDNEQSLVLVVDYCGKRLLLTGDIEGAGLRRLLATEPTDVDVLVAPHHGSRAANPPELIQWCRPEFVVASQGRPRSGATLEVYRDAGIPVYATNERGAITVRIDERGVNVSPMLGVSEQFKRESHAEARRRRG
jgi:competence protein ComEC